jgi:hypothetical protein
VSVLDLDNKLIAYSGTFGDGVREVVSAWGGLYVLSNSGQVILSSWKCMTSTDKVTSYHVLRKSQPLRSWTSCTSVVNIPLPWHSHARNNSMRNESQTYTGTTVTTSTVDPSTTVRWLSMCKRLAAYSRAMSSGRFAFVAIVRCRQNELTNKIVPGCTKDP